MLTELRQRLDGLTEDDLTHLPDISRYNGNYYSWEGYLLFADSDDDNTTTWFLVRPTQGNVVVGMSFCSMDDVIMTDDCYIG